MTTAGLDQILGMLLSPGDVQRIALRLEEAIQQIAGRHHAFPWGVRRMDYTLDAGVLVVQTLDVVLPSGLHVVRHDDRLRLDLRRLPPAEHIVYLTVTQLPAEEANRFLSYGPGTPADETLGDDGLELPRARLRLALATSRPASHDASLPLIKVRHGGGAGEQWSEAAAFVPPMLTLRADSQLATRCRAIADRVRRDADALAAKANVFPPTLASVDARAQLGPLVGALAGFEAVIAGQPHPFTAYVELCRLAAAVSVVRRAPVPVAPAYDHDDLWRIFDVVARSFAPAAPARVQKFTFERDGEGFRLPADEAWAQATAPESHALAILAMESDATEERARRWGENCVIGSRSRMPHLESRRMRGPARTSLRQVDGIPADRRTQLFALTPDANTESLNEDLLVLSGAPDVLPLALHLYVVHPEGVAAGA
jgi:predicted component of type VI protein secretion system